MIGRVSRGARALADSRLYRKKMTAARDSITKLANGEVLVCLAGTHPSLNAWVSSTHAWERDRVKKLWAERIAVAALVAGVRGYRVAPRVVITVWTFFPDGQRRDFDNYVPKFILDGLRGVLLDDDSTEEVVELRLRHGLDRRAWRTEIMIEAEKP